jgi:sulfur-carrier protein adenylyltransferase/sulfurtransferase
VSPRVLLPTPLRAFAAGEREVELDAGTVGEALGELTRRFPGMRRHLFDDAGGVRGYVNLYCNDDPADAGAALEPDDILMIVPSIAGGATDAVGDAAAFSPAEVARYSRHIALPDVGWEGQRRLRDARVLVVGAGGLGSPVSLYLSAAGIGTLGLVDFDTVDVTNLQRQILYGTADIGRPKLEAAAERLSGVNPHVHVVRHDVRLTRENALGVIAGYDVVVDGTDNFATRYLVNDACVLLGKPYVYGSILRFEGQVSVFGYDGGPCYRCLFREPPPPGLVPSCAEGGVLGVLPGIIGSLQALETIKLIIRGGDSLAGRIVLFDALAFRWRELKLRRRPDCPVCGDAPTVTGLIDYDEFCGTKGTDMSQGRHGVPEITPIQLKQRLDAGEPLVVIDVREPFEWDIANLGDHGAKLIPLGELSDRIDEIPQDTDVVVHCRSGSRSASAVRYLLENGYDRVWNLSTGISGWSDDVDAEVQKY